MISQNFSGLATYYSFNARSYGTNTAPKAQTRETSLLAHPIVANDLLDLDAKIDDTLYRLKARLVDKYDKKKAVAHYATLGIVKYGNAYILPRDRTRCAAALQTLLLGHKSEKNSQRRLRHHLLAAPRRAVHAIGKPPYRHRCGRPEFHIHDPHPAREGKGPCCILTTGPRVRSGLHVRIASPRTLHFIAIDQCLYTDADPTKCGCALLDGEGSYFVEFKTSEHARDPTISIANANPGDCLDQLAASIRDFYDRGIIQAGQPVTACASVGFPRNRPQGGAHHQEQLASLQRKVQDGACRQVRLRFCSENELHIN